MGDPSYGTIDHEYFASFFAREDDGPMWALNLMKYRDVARYPDGRETTKSGSEADDEYAPIEQLAAVGARIVLVADVVGQVRGDETTWDRIAVVRYPTRKAIVEMNMREDFQRQHVHKEAGLERTIVMASFPTGGPSDAPPPASGADQRLLLQLVADPTAPDLGAGPSAARLGRFEVEGTMIGDGRPWAEARWYAVDADAAEQLLAGEAVRDETSYAIVMDPQIDELMASVADPTG